MNREATTLLRLEGLAALAVGLAVHARLDGSWLLFAVLFFAPDVSILGYLKDARVGATAYNLGHTYLGPALLGALGWWTGTSLLQGVAVVWLSHIGFDRALGFGLKHPTGFWDTHLRVREESG